MSRGVRLSSMRVDAFRGISDPIDFDLSSPITLIFAPNGTGKTTLCEAAEWLLTGQVERLRDGKDFDPAVLKSKFVLDDRQPSVVADIMVGSEARNLFRAAHGSQQEVSIGADVEDRKTIGPHDLLSFLAPSAASQEAHHLRAINLRQRWLRGTRFLSAETLAALVDSNDETIERRTQVFADLLGIRHLLDAEKLCDQFVSDLSARERSLAQTITGQDAEVAALRAGLERDADRVASGTVSALTEVEAAEAKLGTLVDPLAADEASVAGRIEAVSAEQGRRKHLVDLRVSSVEAVAAEWATRIEIEQKLASLEATERQLGEQLAAIETQGRLTADAVIDATSRQAQQSEQARTLMAARDSLSRLIVNLSGALPNALSPVPSTLGALAQTLPESAWTVDEQARRRAELHGAVRGFESDPDEVRRVELLRAQLDALAPLLTSEEALAVLRTEAANLEAIAIEARGRLEATSDPLARLQAAARDLLTHTHDGDPSACPVCSHDWGTASLLRGAITATLDSLPELARFAQSASTSAAQAARIAQARWEEAVLRNAQAARLRGEIQALETGIAQRRQDLERLGASISAPVPTLQAAGRRLAAAIALGDLLRERDRFAPLLPGTPSPLLANDAPVSGLLEQFGAAIAARDQVIQYQLSTTVRDLQERSATRDRLRGEHALTQQQLRDCRAQLADLRPELVRLRALWEQAAPGRPWTQGALAEARQEVSAELKALAEAAAHAAAAQAAWSVEVRRLRLAELNDAVGPQRRRLEHMGLRIAAAKRAKATFHETYNDVSKRQIDDLSRVVNPLFARMHANRVFDKIKLGQTEEPLRWLADAGSQEMDPGKDFSQGQRQDLALALFLGRARSLGGTFFLDEPVTHLDDLNRVGLLDIFRATVMESSAVVNLVITTASKALARHLIEKFAYVGRVETPEGQAHPLRVLELDGNGRTGVVMRNAFPA